MKKIISILILLILVALIINKYYPLINGKFGHPFPNLTKKYPVLVNVDRIFNFTVGVEWFKTKNKFTGEEYYFKFNNDGRLYINKLKDSNDKWVELSRDDYFDNFEVGTAYKRRITNNDENGE